MREREREWEWEWERERERERERVRENERGSMGLYTTTKNTQPSDFTTKYSQNLLFKYINHLLLGTNQLFE